MGQKQKIGYLRVPKWVKSKTWREIEREKEKERERERKTERLKVGNNNGQLRIAMPPRVVHAKPPGPIKLHDLL